MRLTELAAGKSGIVSSITAGGMQRRRLMDMGFIPGTKVETVRRSPTGNPTAYLIRGTVIALRKEESDMLFIDMV